MDDVNEKLNALLSDPGSMAQIMQLAQQLPPPCLRRLLPRPRRRRHWAASTRRPLPDTCRSYRS